MPVDESSACNKRFEKVKIPQTEGARRSYRELIVTTPGLGEFISGAILYDETIRQPRNIIGSTHYLAFAILHQGWPPTTGILVIVQSYFTQC